MSQVVESPQPSRPAAPVELWAQLEARWALRPRHFVVMLLFVGFFLMLNHFPLRGTDVWCHVSWGNWMLAHHALPQQDPVMPLAQGIPVVDGAWLSQALLAGADRLGDTWIVNCFTLVVAATYLLLARCYFQQTQSVAAAMLGFAAALALGWSRLTTVRPEMFGVLCFAALLALTTKALQREPISRGTKLAIWGLMLVWANLHGSFVVGLGFLLIVGLGQWQSAHRRTRLAEWFFLWQGAALVTLINPYGIDLWIEAVTFGANTNLVNVAEWFPLAYGGIGTLEFICAVLAFMVILRWSPQRFSASDIALLVIFAWQAASHVRMMAWFGPVAVWVLLPHAMQIVRHYFPSKPAEAKAEAVTWRWNWACLLLVWLGLAFSDLGRPILGGREKTTAQLYGTYSPLGITQYFLKHPAPTMAWMPQGWADWLAARAGVPPMMTSNVHLAPSHVWQEYMQVGTVQPGWPQVLERYGIKTLVVDKAEQEVLCPVLRKANDWHLVYEDEQGMVFLHNSLKKTSANTSG